MVLKRLFIGNLPEKLTADELSSKFSSFGNVEDVEVKTKNEATFGFVSLFVEEEKNLKHCIDVLNNTKWRGNLIKVQLAKESFMDKLKREQAEAKEKANRPVGIISFEDEPENSTNNNMGTLMTNYYNDLAKGQVKSLLPHLAAANKSTEDSVAVESVKSKLLLPSTTPRDSNPIFNPNVKFDKKDSYQKKNDRVQQKSKQVDLSDSDDSDGEVSAQGLPRFRGILAYPELNAPLLPPVEKELVPEMKSTLKIESVVAKQPIGKRLLEVAEASPLNFKKRNSDQIRQQSMEARLNLNKNRSAIIKNSLLHTNIEPPVNQPSPSTAAKKKKTPQNNLSQNLFDDDDPTEDVGNSFKIKPQFEGQSGQKNFELSSKFAAYDNRFVIDERFKDDKEKDEKNDEGEANLEQEKLASFSILSDILGTTVTPNLQKNKSTNKKSSVIIKRYDPENDDEVEESHEMDISESNSNLIDKEKSTKNVAQEKVVEEPKAATYYVASNLKELLTSNSTGFSLLDTFGTQQNGHSNNKHSLNDDNEYTTQKKGKGESSFWQKKNPFKYDSSDSENEDDKSTQKVTETSTSNGHHDVNHSKKLPKKERFFFSKNDSRFEGVTDFFLNSTEDMNEVLYRFNNGERSELKLICKSKVKNTKRKSDKRMETLKRLKRKLKEKNRKKVTLEGSNAVPLAPGANKLTGL